MPGPTAIYWSSLFEWLWSLRATLVSFFFVFEVGEDSVSSLSYTEVVLIGEGRASLYIRSRI